MSSTNFKSPKATPDRQGVQLTNRQPGEIKLKKSFLLVPCALFGTLAFGQSLPQPSTQSNVTIYGLISTGIVYTNNTGGKNLVTEGSPMQLPRLGFKGTEVLDGQTNAFFVLEQGFSSDTGNLGQGGRSFGRYSLVRLDSRTYGSVALGRQLDMAADALCYYEAACQFAGFGTHVGDSDNLFIDYRVNNSVTYRTPSIAGVTAALQYGSSDAVAKSDNRAYSGSLKYTSGNLSLGAAFNNVDRPNSATNSGGAVSGDYGFSSPFITSRVLKAGVGRQHAAGFGGSYDMGVNHFSAIYTRSMFNYLDATRLDVGNYEVVASRQFTPHFLMGVGYTYTQASYHDGSADPKWHQINAGAVYNFSKRTDVYAVANYQKAAGGATFARIYTQAASSDKQQAVFGVGIRHRF